MKNNFRTNLISLLNNSFVQRVLYSPVLDYHQWSLLKFVKENARKIKSTEKIIDIGAGELKYRQYFRHCIYRSQDLCVGDSKWDFSGIDIISSAYDIPEDNHSYDYILCIQVLEHLEFPDKAFTEFNRLLKTGGRLLLSAPLGQGEHQIPHDYFRYTQYGLRSLGERSGFKLVLIQPHGGIFISLEYVLWILLGVVLPFENSKLFRYSVFIVLLPIKMLSGLLFIALDVLDRKKQYTLNYNCVYEKK